MELLLATGNPGKAAEYQRLLDDHLPGTRIRLPADLGLDLEVDEDGDSFEANARLKVAAFAALAALPVLADDSGLEVAALDGFPGIHSARWSGPTDRDRNRALLARMAGRPPAERAARFVCVVVYRDPSGREWVGRGTLEGRLLEAPRGAGGFGYDPLFFVPALGRTLAEIPRATKNRISHRATALAALAAQLRDGLPPAAGAPVSSQR